MFANDRSVMLLRWSLGVVFLWFGVLKLFNVSPVLEMIRTSLPSILSQSQLFMLLLSFLEIIIGIAYLANRFVKTAATIMIAHLIIASLSVLITQGFSPRFPVLSLAGEFVVKNIVLIAAGFVLLSKKPSMNKP